ncbi:MAG: helix-turn-helix domain-containing protein [Candidatus Korarchaeota archaeon]|nr:helix-turn-helix domain-containing protein [Candidatus Korarchaeota archaeon]NIU85490.1 helix-turn-helix domain-containing protein [Candidatus Thorarchaeota archaeon]NIW15607.1 helix-turn-helix domain-containing protein [Candidatus Thorarchaeota archaeon]NIW53538.1 helix-turn-helix domain-containing protein [Candidatus Korarchaeota archaeon]
MVLSALKPERFEILKKDLSLSQVGDQPGISKSTVRAYLSALKQVGIIED